MNPKIIKKTKTNRVNQKSMEDYSYSSFHAPYKFLFLSNQLTVCKNYISSLRGVALLFLSLFVLTNTVKAQNIKLINDELQKRVIQEKLSDKDILEWTITSEHTSSKNGIHHVYYRQQIGGIPIYGTEGSLHVSNKGKIISSQNNFVKDAISKRVGKSTPQLTSLKALGLSVKHLGVNEGVLNHRVVSKNNANKTLVIEAKDIANSPIPVKLIYFFSKKDNKIHLAWDICVDLKKSQSWWNIKIDANTGGLLSKKDWLLRCGDANHEYHSHDLNEGRILNLETKTNILNSPLALGNYEVFALPDESPARGSGSRKIISNPDNGAVSGSPFGWHDTNGVVGNEFTRTQGNNVHVFEGGDNLNFSPDGGASLDFTTGNSIVDFSFNPIYTTTNQSEPASLVNVFYLANVAHDILFEYGFDEAAGNFQETNYSGNGKGSDYLKIEAQDDKGCDAGSVTITPDGLSPTMEIGACDERDCSFDNIVILHEYTHGLTTRLTGGADNSSCLFSTEALGMGEGWSDWYGLMFTLKSGDKAEDPKTIATWFNGQAPNGPGNRTVPYTTDMSLNSQTYATVETADIPHGVGTVWAEMLWEMTWLLIDAHGLDNNLYNYTGDATKDAGNIQALAIVTEALKIQPCNPGFVDGRDAILAADEAIYGGVNKCLIWAALAKRGLGVDASQGDASSVFDGIESFDVPKVALKTVSELCINEGVQNYGQGFPEGGVYSGSGVTDNGDGKTYTFNPVAAGLGTHAITYTANKLCGSSTTATSTIKVTTALPELVCKDITVNLDSSGTASIDYTDVISNLLPPIYEVNQTGTFAPVDIKSTGGIDVPLNLFGSSEDVSSALPIGFSFNFYGQDYTEFYMSSNGFITFNDNSATSELSGVIPKADNVNNIIAAGWGSFQATSIIKYRYKTIGSSPNRKLVVEFDNLRFSPPGGLLNTQIHLWEGSNRIEMHSKSLSTGSRGVVTQGIENADGTQAAFVVGRVKKQNLFEEDDYIAFQLGSPRIANNCGTITVAGLSKTNFTGSDLGDNNITVTLTDTKGNKSTCDLVVTVKSATLSTEDAMLSESLKLYPNPVKDYLNIIYTGLESIKSVVVYDLSGRQVKSMSLNNDALESISMQGVASGMYFVEIKTEKARVSKRIVKK